jgi:transposase InsO family protein
MTGHDTAHAAFLDYAKHSGLLIKLCRPYRAKTKGKVERFNGYLRRCFYVPLVSRLGSAGLKLDAVTANEQVRRWLDDIAHERIHGATGIKPSERLQEERPYLQALPQPWRADIAAARPQRQVPDLKACARPPVVMERLSQEVPIQHALCVYERLLQQVVQGAAA